MVFRNISCNCEAFKPLNQGLFSLKNIPILSGRSENGLDSAVVTSSRPNKRLFKPFMTRNLLQLATIITLSACSIQLDSQYGFRIHAGKIEAGSRSNRTVSAEWAAPTEVGSIGNHEDPSVALNTSFLEAQPLSPVRLPMAEPTQSNAIGRAILNAERPQQISEPVEGFDATLTTKKPERSMTVAWILWAIPAVLIILAGGGFLLNFGAHWYYLGDFRKALARTIVWALTVVAFSIVVFFASSLGLNLLASLIALVFLIPLGVIQIIGIISDFIALQNMAKNRAPESKQNFF